MTFWDRLAYWNFQHRIRARALKIGFLYLVLMLAGATAAHADGGSVGMPFIGLPANITDSHGISITQYATLPLDRGDGWTLNKSVVSFIVDIIWAGHIYYIAWLLMILKLLLGFEWITWLAAPVAIFAAGLQNLVNTMGLATLSTITAGVIGAWQIARGRFASGIGDWFVGAVILVLVTGFLSAPVALLTGPDGFLTKSKQWGGELSLAITSDPSCYGEKAALAQAHGEQAPGCPATDAPADQVLTQTVMAQITDSFVREPAIILVFGKSLSAECTTVYDTKIKERSPLDTGETTVRNAVGDCDKDAKAYVESPFPNKVIDTMVVAGGSFALNLLAWGMAIFAILCAVQVLMSAMALPLKGVVAIAGPFRASFYRSLFVVLIGCALLVGATVLLAAWMSGISTVLRLTTALGLRTQMLLVDLLVIVFIIWIFRLKKKANAKGQKLADKLAELTKAKPAPVKENRLNRAWENHGSPFMKRAAKEALLAGLRYRGRSRRPAPAGWFPGAGPLTDLGEKRTPAASRRGLRGQSPRQLGPGSAGNSGAGTPVGPRPGGPTTGAGQQVPEVPQQAALSAGTKAKALGAGAGNSSKSSKVLDTIATVGRVIPHPIAQGASKAATAASTAQQGTRLISSTTRIHKDADGKARTDRVLHGVVVDPPAFSRPQGAGPQRSARTAQLAARLSQHAPVKAH